MRENADYRNRRGGEYHPQGEFATEAATTNRSAIPEFFFIPATLSNVQHLATA